MTYRQRKIRRRRRRGRTSSPFGLALAVVAITIAIGVLSIAGYVLAVAATAPDLSELKPQDKGASSLVLAADGSRLGYVRSDEIRTPIRWTDMPRVLRDATVAIEDERFYKHKGVDYGAIVRAGIKNLESGGTVQGGSTITQQLVRSLYIKDPKRNLQRKIREAKLASELEQEHTKTWILKAYLNSVPYGTVGGRTALGVEAAAETFFAKHATQLTLAEAALLAGLPQAPSQYNPFRNPTAALERRGEVLKRMVDNGYITQAQADEAAATKLNLRRGTRYTARREPYFFDFVEERLIEKYGAAVYRRGGLRIHTTVDRNLQAAARDAIQQNLTSPTGPSAAIVSIDPETGYIRAMASSGTYKDRSFNLAAQGHRQPGSAFKTMVLLAAISRGVDPNRTTYVSKPLNINDPVYGHWAPKTYSNTYGGAMNLVTGTLKSDNTVYAQLILDLGPKAVRETAYKMGIKTHLDAYPAEGLGGLKLGVSPLEMANAYATLASGGWRNEPEAITKVEFPDGKTDDIGKPKRTRAFTDGETYEVTKILQRNVQAGTGTRASFGCPAAGKTGTTDKFNDAWFVGYTPTLATSTWVGHPNALLSMPGVAGGTIPASIWHDYMVVARGDDCESFPQPTERAQFSPFFGKYARTGRSGSYDYDNDGAGAGDNSAGGGEYRGYDPRLYETPPQNAPAPELPRQQRQPAPSAPTQPQRGNGNGGGNGGGNGNAGGGDLGGIDG
jgi:penicillin-binding protein 1A